MSCSIDDAKKTMRQVNQYILEQDEDCKSIISEMRQVEEFLHEFGFLTYGRDYIMCGGYVFSLQLVSAACELTVGSIISCCQSGCLADAYTLLRKYRDDLFFYLYIMVYDAIYKLESSSKQIDSMRERIEEWINNGLQDMHIGKVLRAISKYPGIEDAVKKFRLKLYFDKIRVSLNNYVHSNGVGFYNRNVNSYNKLHIHMRDLLNNLRFITITFLFLLTLCSPHFIMSTDYIDCLENNMTPPEGSQHRVAPFVADFFQNNQSLIDDSCMRYLMEKTNMEFE